MQNFTPLASLLGGMLIGLSASFVLVGLGRIAGISGIYSGLLSPVRGEVAWRAAFLLGLLGGGFTMARLSPQLFAATSGTPWWTVVVAGVLVGFGTRMSNGCTSGHGVCGVGRGSPRSYLATATFMATGILTVYLVRQLVGGSP